MDYRRQTSFKRLGLRDSLTSPKQEKLIPKDKSTPLYSFSDQDIFTISGDQNILDSLKDSQSDIKKSEVTKNRRNRDSSSKSRRQDDHDGKQLRAHSWSGSSPEITITIEPPSPCSTRVSNALENRGFNAMRELMVRSMFSPGPMTRPATPTEPGGRHSAEDEEKEEEDQEKEDGGNEVNGQIAYLTVPSVSSSRRPSTADVVIEKLQVEKVEGGGITISGVALAANCHLTLMIFGIFFVLAGVVLSYVGFAFIPNDPPPKAVGPVVAQPSGSANEEKKSFKTHRQMQVIGPVFIAGGLLMFLLGLSLFAISIKINRDEKERRLLMSAMQLCQLESSFSQDRSKTISSPVHTISAPSQNQDIPVLSLRRGSWWMEPTPVEYPLIPSEVIPGSDCPPSYSRSESIRSSSPHLESGMTWGQQQSSNDKNSYPQQPPSSQHQQQKQLLSHQQQQHLQQLQHHHQQQQQQQKLHQQHPFTTKRLSSSISTFYGSRDGASDIATFPLENSVPANSFPLRVQSVKEDSRKEEEEGEGGEEGEGRGEDEEVSSSQERKKLSFSTGESPNSSSAAGSVPVITVSSVTNVEKGKSISSSSAPKPTTPSPNRSPRVSAVQPVSTNFPLTRNGIALPRHSRHRSVPKAE